MSWQKEQEGVIANVFFQKISEIPMSREKNSRKYLRFSSSWRRILCHLLSVPKSTEPDAIQEVSVNQFIGECINLTLTCREKTRSWEIYTGSKIPLWKVE